jgi:hypothetical protein
VTALVLAALDRRDLRSVPPPEIAPASLADALRLCLIIRDEEPKLPFRTSGSLFVPPPVGLFGGL